MSTPQWANADVDRTKVAPAVTPDSVALAQLRERYGELRYRYIKLTHENIRLNNVLTARPTREPRREDGSEPTTVEPDVCDLMASRRRDPRRW